MIPTSSSLRRVALLFARIGCTRVRMVRVWAACLLVSWTMPNSAPAQIAVEGSYTVLRTGSNEPLFTLSLPLASTPAEASTQLRLDFGFATSEVDASDTFFDSFSLTLGKDGDAATALLLTADRTGVQWAPPNPGGLALTPTNVQANPISFPGIDPVHAIQFAYSIRFVLPSVLLGGPLTLFLDLFDNLNHAASLAFVGNLRLETETAFTVRLHSASAVAGPYAEEVNATLDSAQRTLSVPKPSGLRFFRLIADQPSRIVSITPVGGHLVIQYQAIPLRLLSAANPEGPYTVETTATLNSNATAFLVNRPPGNRFFRIEADRPVKITSLRVHADRLWVEFQFIEVGLDAGTAATSPSVAEAAAVPGWSTRALGEPIRHHSLLPDSIRSPDALEPPVVSRVSVHFTKVPKNHRRPRGYSGRDAFHCVPLLSWNVRDGVECVPTSSAEVWPSCGI